MTTPMRTLMAICGAALLASACDSSTSPVADAGNNDAGNNDAGVDAGPADAGCYSNPTTDYEIENACTDAGFIDKTPNLPLLLSDGGLPPLP